MFLTLLSMFKTSFAPIQLSSTPRLWTGPFNLLKIFLTQPRLRCNPLENWKSLDRFCCRIKDHYMLYHLLSIHVLRCLGEAVGKSVHRPEKERCD